MNHHTIPLHITEAQHDQLRTTYEDLRKDMERKLFVRLDPLKSALQEVLHSQDAWPSIAALPATQHHLIHLMHNDNAILNLPWRLVFDGMRYRYISKGLHKDGAIPAYTPQIPLPLKILAMIASPEDAKIGARLSYEEEEARIIAAFEPLFAQGNIEIDFTEDGSLQSLEAKLQHNHYHILHFSGHGSYKDGKGYLLLENAITLKQEIVSAEQFAAALNKKEKHRPPLILLSSCQTAQGNSTTESFAGVTNQLLQIGVPTVIAMGFSILDFYATAFAAQLYRMIAEQHHIPMAFQNAVDHIRTLQNANRHNQLPPQHIIPQLYANQSMEDLLDWQQPEQKLRYEAFKFISGENKLLLEHADNFRFIGRRRERRDALAALNQEPPQPVLLKGQGGVGKTTLAVHLVQRLIIKKPNTIPFAFNQNTTSISSILDRLMDFFAQTKKQFLIKSDVQKEAGEEAIQQYLYLLQKLAQDEDYNFVFIFDNLENFQDGKDRAPFKTEYSGIQQAIQLLITYRPFPLILTGRYPLHPEDFAGVEEVNLNQVGFPSFFVKCAQMQLSELRQHLNVPKDALQAQAITYKNVIQLLHTTLGGNYRALEFFDRLYVEKRADILPTLDKLDALKAQIAEKGAAAVQEMSQNLVFADLLALPGNNALHNLHLLTHFRIPVLQLALEMQEAELHLQPLIALTLLEAHNRPYANGQVLTYYYVTPIVRQLLQDNVQDTTTFNHTQAARYYEWINNNINHSDYTDLEEAFFHYYTVQNTKKVNIIGDILCQIYHDIQLFPIARQYGKQVEALLQEETHGRIWNNLGLIAKLYGNLDVALVYLEKSKVYSQERKDRKAEGTTLNNISQIYDARGDYATALEYLEQSLAIRREIGDKYGEGTTLNNISQIYAARGDYATALEYLEQSLAIRREIGDKYGEGRTLNNISQIYDARGDYATALEYLEQSLAISREIGDKSGEGTTLNNISQIYAARGDYATALEYLEQSLAISREIGDKYGEGRTLNNISQIYDARGDYATALEYLEQSLAISREIGDKSGEGRTLNNISQIYDARGDYATALEYLEQSLAIRREIGDKSGEGRTLNNISQIYDARGDYATALEYLEQSLAISREIGDKSGESTTLNNISQIFKARGDYATALEYLEQSLAISREIGDKSGEGTALHNMALVAYAKEDYALYGQLEMEAYQIFMEINYAQGIYVIGRNFGAMLCEVEDEETKAMGLQMLQRSLTIGEQGGLPDVEEVRELVAKYS